MLTIFNEKMKKLLIECNQSDAKLESIAIRFLNLFCPKFIEWDGCVLLRYGNKLEELPEKFAPNSMIIDRTQFEAVTNHIHLSDVFEEIDGDSCQTLKIALGLAEIWGNKLSVEFPTEKFHLVISHDEFGSVIRFYKIRNDEVSWLNIVNLDDFKEEALLVKEIG